MSQSRPGPRPPPKGGTLTPWAAGSRRWPSPRRRSWGCTCLPFHAPFRWMQTSAISISTAPRPSAASAPSARAVADEISISRGWDEISISRGWRRAWPQTARPARAIPASSPAPPPPPPRRRQASVCAAPAPWALLAPTRRGDATSRSAHRRRRLEHPPLRRPRLRPRPHPRRHLQSCRRRRHLRRRRCRCRRHRNRHRR